jgi:hypothetical protein
MGLRYRRKRASLIRVTHLLIPKLSDLPIKEKFEWTRFQVVIFWYADGTTI